MTDTIDALVGIAPGDPTDSLRRRRPTTVEQLQASYDALFAPVDDSAFPIAERWLVAAFATRLTADDETARFYADRALEADPERGAIVVAEAIAAATPGPFGLYLEPGLSGESTEGRRYEASASGPIDERLAAALTHAHLLVARPREAHEQELAALRRAGWSIDGIVTLSQLVAFLAFQQRVAHGLRALASAEERAA